MTGKRKRLILTIVFALLFGIILYISRLGSPDGKQTLNAPPLPEQAIEKFSVTETEAGKPHWVLEASSAQILENQKRVYLQSPVIKFYEKGNYVSTLVAQKGRINTENYDIWGEGQCTLDTAKGEKLETSNLYYRSDIKKIVTEDKVKLIRPNEVVYGKGMEASPDLESIKIRNQRVEMKNNPAKDKAE